MTEEIINADGSRNWEANILLDNIHCLEQDSKQLTQWLDEARRNADFWCDKCTSLEQENKELKEQAQLDGECIDKLIEARDMYAKTLEEIRSIAQDAIDRKFASNSLDYSEGQECIGYYVMEKINEVLGNEQI